MRSLCGDLAFVHDDYFIRVLNGRNALRDNYFCRVRYFLAERLSYKRVRVSIDCGGGVVKDKYLGLFQKRTGNTESLLLPAGNIRAALFYVGVVFVGEALDELGSLTEIAYTLNFLVGGVRVAPAKILFDSAREQDILLKNDRNSVPQRYDTVFFYINAADADSTLSSIVQTGDELDKA